MIRFFTPSQLLIFHNLCSDVMPLNSASTGQLDNNGIRLLSWLDLSSSTSSHAFTILKPCLFRFHPLICPLIYPIGTYSRCLCPVSTLCAYYYLSARFWLQPSYSRQLSPCALPYTIRSKLCHRSAFFSFSRFISEFTSST